MKPKDKASILPLEENEDIEHDKVIMDYELVASETRVESNAQELQVNSDAEYQNGTLQSEMMHRDVVGSSVYTQYLVLK